MTKGQYVLVIYVEHCGMLEPLHFQSNRICIATLRPVCTSQIQGDPHHICVTLLELAYQQKKCPSCQSPIRLRLSRLSAMHILLILRAGDHKGPKLTLVKLGCGRYFVRKIGKFFSGVFKFRRKVLMLHMGSMVVDFSFSILGARWSAYLAFKLSMCRSCSDTRSLVKSTDESNSYPKVSALHHLAGTYSRTPTLWRLHGAGATLYWDRSRFRSVTFSRGSG